MIMLRLGTSEDGDLYRFFKVVDDKTACANSSKYIYRKQDLGQAGLVDARFRRLWKEQGARSCGQTVHLWASRPRLGLQMGGERCAAARFATLTSGC
jgi:hypothetical protein